VADTENHLIRQIDLKSRAVSTIAGTGTQMRGRGIAGPARTVALNSPWDLQLAGRTLYIAMAGPHQIWKLELDKQEISTFAGSGREARVDGPLIGPPFGLPDGTPPGSAFAQPSALATDGKTLFVSDAEANIIRAISLGAGAKVRTVAGGDLFDFGDKDGLGDEVRLQHPLGLARWNGKLLIADTYNHRIKLLDPASREVRAFAGSGKPGQDDGNKPSFYEPGGLAVTTDKLYVADTNNHAIRVVDLKTKKTKTLPIKGLQPPAPNQTATNDEVAPNAEEIQLPLQRLRSGDAALVLNVELPAGYHLNPDAPQRYSYSVSIGSANEAGKSPPLTKSKTEKGLSLPVRIPFSSVSDVTGEHVSFNLQTSFTFVYCRNDNTGTCRIKTFNWRAPVEVVNDPNVSNEVRLSGKVPAE